MTFNIPDLANIKLPDGYTYAYSLYDFDGSGINTATVSSVGAVTVTFKNVFKNRKEYRLRYKIRQIGGNMSKTGEIYFCMRNQCNTCTGKCDPLTADCLTLTPFDVVVECGQTVIVNIPNWNPTNINFQNVPVCVSNISFNTGTKNLTVEISASAGGCMVGQRFPIKVVAGIGTVTDETNVFVTIIDKSLGVTCPQGQAPNKCTGDCEPIPSDLQIGMGGLDLQVI